MIKHTTHFSRGMTLVEVLIALAIFVAVMGAVGLFEVNIFSYQSSISSSFTTVQDAEIILKTMTREIRMTSPSSDGSYAIQTAATNTIMFFADTDGNGIKERIRYYLVGNKLYRASLVPTGSPFTYTGTESITTLLNNVRNATSTAVFEYFDGSYDGNEPSLSQPVNVSSVRLVKINITLDTDPNRSPAPRTYTTQVTLRNLKNNL
jgi:prepilin-type N-terminal cleavage/methylation domain-containing protein